MDSLMMIDLAAGIRRLLGLPIPATRLFDFGTIDALVDYLVVELDRAGSDDGAPGTHQR
jgi:acyl carrier protein